MVRGSVIISKTFLFKHEHRSNSGAAHGAQTRCFLAKGKPFPAILRHKFICTFLPSHSTPLQINL